MKSMKRLWRYILRRLRRAPERKKSERERRLERQWADMLRYEGRPLYEQDED